MTTDVEALIKRLRTCYGNCDDELNEAADALQSQAEHIQGIESSNGHLRGALRAQSDKIQSMALQSISDEANRERLQAKIDEQDGRIQALEAKCAELERDAGRYRWLRLQHWSTSDMAVVRTPENSVKLGSECPSRERLDEAIDTAIAAQAGSKEGA